MQFWVKHFTKDNSQDAEKQAFKKELASQKLPATEIEEILKAEYPVEQSSEVFSVLEENENTWWCYLAVCSEWQRDFHGALKLDKLGAGEIIKRLDLNIEPVDYHKLLMIEQFVIREL